MALFFKIKELCNIALTRNLHARQKLYSVSPEKWLCFAKKRFLARRFFPLFGFWLLDIGFQMSVEEINDHGHQVALLGPQTKGMGSIVDKDKLGGNVFFLEFFV